jgi:cell division protein FtsI (penicillin-binding protein 3)
MMLHKERIALIFFIFCGIYVLITLNLYFIQIHKSSFFTHLASQQYNIAISQYPPRAPIFDRSGTQCLARNRECISAFIMPRLMKDKATTTAFLARNFPHAYERLQHNPDTSFLYVKRRLSPEEQATIEQAHLADIQLLSESSRFYPVPSASPVVGLTNIDNKGHFGIERQFDHMLAGTPSEYSLEKDARSGYFHFKKETHVEGTHGNPITLTIDGDLQFLVAQELEETLKKFNAPEGTVIIMNPQNGDILSMVSAPYFDPNNTLDLDIETTKNNAITNAYEPGSVMKVFAALAALEEGVVSFDEIINCKNTKTTYIDGRRINTWKEHGELPFCDVIAFSNNIGIAIVAKRLGNTLYEHYTRLGFGSKTDIALPGENAGSVNHPDNWSKQSIISLSYGYEISTNTLQLARAFSLIATGGYLIEPRIVLDGSDPERSEKLYSDVALENIRAILARTTEQGTAHRAKIKGYNIMTKTGTAILLTNGKYDDKRNIFTCAGIVEKDGYQRVIVAFVKEAHGANLFASTVAAPLFEKVAEKMLIHDRIL